MCRKVEEIGYGASKVNYGKVFVTRIGKLELSAAFAAR